MKLDVIDSNENLIFKITDFDKKYVPVFEMCFYLKEDDYYYKKFAKSSRNVENCKANFIEHGEAMYNQLGYFSSIPWEQGLLAFCEKMAEAQISFWVTGSVALTVRGIGVKPHDVDIMVSSEDCDKISDLFSEYLFEPINNTNGWVTKDFGVIFNHCRIDIASDPSPILDSQVKVDCGPYAKDNLEEVVWNGIILKVPPIELSLNANKLRNRLERVALIEDYMKK